MPLQLLFEEIYYLIGWKLVKDYGLAIVVLSLTVNLLVLPLYNRADAVQEAEREIDAKLRKGVEHIKKTFKGDEQLMILQAYYRENNYSPLDALKGSISLFLEIPFFVAAYQFLSHLSVLQGASLGPIQDLSQPDGLLQVAGMTINVMPLIMTVINIAATALFVNNMPLKTKVQLYGLAFFFLVFLYKSPSGLVFYWTLNNLFNLCKTIVYKYWKPKQAEETGVEATQHKFFLAGAAFMAILTGLLIPSSVIGASADEFIIKGYMENPLWYLVSSFTLATGAFVLWLGVFYWLATPKGRVRYECFVGGFSLVAICTYMIWGQGGLVTPVLKLSSGLINTKTDRIVNAVFVVAVAVALHFVWEKYRKYIYEALCLGCVAMVGMSGLNIMHAKESLANVMASKAEVSTDPNSKHIVLSKTGKNVVVLMLDGALGSYIPYMLQEKPELKEVYSGFTFYENVTSFGGHTLYGSPGIFGGYEYVPEQMNLRKDKLLKDKQNEALLMLPRILHDQGYAITLSTPPLMNYQNVPDYAPMKAYPYIRGENFAEAEAEINSKEEYLDLVAKNNRNFFCFGLLKTVPVVLQGNIYGNGRYCRFDYVKDQTMQGKYKADGISKTFMGYYKALEELPAKTKLVETGNTYLAMTNDITHDNAMLQLPDYVPAEKVDNTKFAQENSPVYMYKGRKLQLNSRNQNASYQCGMAAFLKLGEWINYLKQQGVYDNTRIILVSDHGGSTGQVEALQFGRELGLKPSKLNDGDATAYHCLLMVKDFNSKDFTVSDEFMTNAEVPTLVLKDIVANPVNPFTGKPVTNEARNKEQYIFESIDYAFRHNSGNTFPSGRWYAVKNNIWDKKNWRLAKEDAQLPY